MSPLFLIVIVVFYCYCFFFCTVPIHRVVLAGASDYFKTAFSSKWNNTHNEFSFTVQHDEIIAFKAILKFFYSSNLPQDIPINELFKMFRLSDILIADYIMRSIERRILAISNDVIQNNDLISYFDLH